MNTNTFKLISAFLALVGTIWLGLNTIATKEEVVRADTEINQELVIVQNDLIRHKSEDKLFYTNRRINEIKQQESFYQKEIVRDCRHIKNPGAQTNCMRLELQRDILERSIDGWYE